MGTYGLRSVHPDFSTPPGFQFLQNGDDHYGRGVVVGYRDKVAARLIPGAAAATHRMPPKRRLVRRGTVVEDVPATATPARPASRPRTPGSAPVEAVDSPDGADTATDFGAAGAGARRRALSLCSSARLRTVRTSHGKGPSKCSTI